MIKTSVDSSGLRSKMLAAADAAPNACAGALVEAAEYIAAAMAVQPHQDTRRWSRAWIQAARQVGAWRTPVPALRPSKYFQELRSAVTKFRDQQRQDYIRLVAKRDALYPQPPRNQRTGLYGKLSRQIEKTKARMDKAQTQLQQLGANQTALVLHAGAGFSGQGKRAPQVVTRVYGGFGAVVKLPRGAILRLENLEPHARIVESKFKILAAVRAPLRGLALKRAARQIVSAARAVSKAG